MFVAFYACCIGIGLWRLIKYPTARTWILFRPALVIAIRIAGNVLRYMEATSDSFAPNKGRIVAEQVRLAFRSSAEKLKQLNSTPRFCRSLSFSATSSFPTRCSYFWRVSLPHARPLCTTVELDRRRLPALGCSASAISLSSPPSSSDAM